MPEKQSRGQDPESYWPLGVHSGGETDQKQNKQVCGLPSQDNGNKENCSRRGSQNGVQGCIFDKLKKLKYNGKGAMGWG